jgi:EAL domain-containing protein (putative c-di-GMP-specific phosphodiesterase class I)/PAS domain-containing protein
MAAASEQWRSMEALRGERDRFVAFAFAAADLLLELDAGFRIRFVSGAAAALTARSPEDLVDSPFFDLFMPIERPMVRAFLTALSVGGRMTPAAVRLAGSKAPSVVIGGCRLPAQEERYHVSLSIPVPAAPPELEGVTTESRLLDKDAFSRLASETVKSPHPYTVTLLDVAGLEKLRARVSGELAAGLVQGIGRQLQARSLNGSSAGELGDGRFGVLHEGALDLKGLVQQITTFSKSVDPEGEGLGVSGMTIAPGASGLGEDDAARVLVYAINRFADSGADFTAATLASGVTEFIRTAATQVNRLRLDLAEDRFELAFQPIVRLSGRKVHHYEALLRFARGVSPGDRIVFAEQTGIVEDLDIAVLCRTIDMIERSVNPRPVIAVNLSGCSLQRAAFRGELERLLVPSLAKNIMLEVTESSIIDRKEEVAQFLQALRKAGFRVCLDDFGAGASSFDYLKAFAVDFIKIDGKYIRGVVASERDQTFVTAMTDLAKRLSIAVIAEQTETEEQSVMLTQLGVEYAQGYLFGRPGQLPTPLVGQPQKRRAGTR